MSNYRLSKLARELDSKIATIVHYAEELGYQIDCNPNTKIDKELYEKIVEKVDSIEQDNCSKVNNDEEFSPENLSSEEVLNYKNRYTEIIVESFIPDDLNARHGEIHIRPVKGQSPFNPNLFVACSKSLSSDYPIGTKFQIKAKLVQRKDGAFYIYSNYTWRHEVIDE
ncbi:MAG: hypothetical protein WED10_06410 [Brumimicrobium sp.]